MKRQQETNTEWEQTQSRWTCLGAYLQYGVVLLAAIGAGIAYPCGLSSQIPEEVRLPYWIAVLGAGTLALVMILKLTIQTEYTHWELTKDRLTWTTGVLHRETDDLELYRVRDLVLDYPFPCRLFDRGSVIIYSNDEMNPIIVVGLVKDPKELFHKLLVAIERRKQEVEVREKEELVELKVD